ncbi:MULTISPECIES: helix-turn-helix domain-containing protein [unclassified Streptomyces]|uniref:helix-turn-helix domain-containing protein n=1 Tax=unclassified Streptomyces TaxID=2593676 RepID=UPI000F6EFBE1|nr:MULTISPECIES: helix-turn-helix transcriptional regulator [unclassified Streptomyces]AZM58250.1 transcriptional regulator [Streptomyces sp. WAC 01438]RSM98949.1 transcriptional regulator [Streptomyces sp. WAC 01420]
MTSRPGDHAGNRSDIRDFLVSRRARLTPEQVGLPTSGRRRVPGLRREEVAVLAGVSTEWYTRLEKGHIGGVSEEVLDAVAQALDLDADERTYLFDLARAARPARSGPPRRKDAEVQPSVQWMLDSMTMSAAFVRNGRSDIIASNALFRVVCAPMFDSPTCCERDRPNFPRYFFLDPGAPDFFVDWEAGAKTSVALLRAEAGRAPHDRALRELIGELSTLSPVFRTLWAQHDVRVRHDGVKRLRHPEAGDLEFVYRSLSLPVSDRVVHDVIVYTAEPGTTTEERLGLLASWAATRTPTTEHTGQPR